MNDTFQNHENLLYLWKQLDGRRALARVRRLNALAVSAAETGSAHAANALAMVVAALIFLLIN